jgi:hypothetical protein
MSLWSSLLDVFKTISTQTILPFAGPLIGAAIAFLGVVFGQYLAHRYTHRREHEKLLREKAEELINTLCKIDHGLSIWHEGLERDAHVLRPTEREAIGKPRSASVGACRLPEPGKYETLVQSMHLDVQRVDTLQFLYFPVLAQRYFETYTSALFPLVEWLSYQTTLQQEDSSHWPEQFHAEDMEQWRRLNDAYATALKESIEVIARTILPYHEPPRVLSLLRRR